MKKTISGIRGIVGEDLTISDVIGFCRNFATIAGRRCVTGMDTRPSSELVARAAHAGLMAGGADVYALGMVPTPVVFREARSAGAGVMITSSHNPLEWNGLKFVLHGRGINESELPAILGYNLHNCHGRMRGLHGSRIQADMGRVGSEYTGTTSYVTEAARVIGSVDGFPRIAVDVGGGASVHVARQLYQEIGCQADVINAEPRSRGPDPTVDPLCDLVSTSKAYDAGFAFDLDGDRLVIVTDGAIQPPDVTLGLGVAGALDRGCKKFVLSTDTSTAVGRLITSRGGTFTTARVGEANVVDEMIRTGAQAGGEGSSGGFILAEFNHCRDGILAGGMIARMLKEDRGMLDDTLDILGDCHVMRTKMQADPALHDEMISGAKAWMTSRCSKVHEADGIKGTMDDNGWILVRKSNTEDVIRISVEALDEPRCRRLTGEIKDVMKQTTGRR